MADPFPDATTLLGRGTTAVAAARAALDRIAAREGEVRAWAWLDPPAALDEAAVIDRRPARGPLHGIPIAVKDVIQTAGMPTRYNCDAHADAGPTPDAACVATLRTAGALLLGKAETVELASIGRVAPTRNPHAPEHTPGGSSSGSAAAVADGHVPIALGTQTGGSIIRPASFCGVWALKPSWGVVSTEGVKPFAPSLDTVGWFARSAADLALVLDVFDPAPVPAAPRDIAGARIALWHTAGWPQAGAATREAIAATVAAIVAGGGTVVPLDAPPALDGLAEAHRTVMMAEGARSFLAEYRRAPDALHPRIAAMVRDADGIGGARLVAAYDRAARARAAFDALAAGFDAVLAPSTVAEAPHGLAHTGDLLFNGLFTLLHVPCVNLPFHHAANGLPVGVTITGPRFADGRTIAMAAAIADACRAAAGR